MVSHGHGYMAPELIARLKDCPEVAQIIWTRNIPEPELGDIGAGVTIIDNEVPKGFGANHNAAFRACRQPVFCVLNPDVEWSTNPFQHLVATLNEERAALVAPEVVSPFGRVEDSMRRYPTWQSLMAKALLGDEGRAPPPVDSHLSEPDWVAGMFMLIRASDFEAIGGFDEAYFLYYEDIELCARLRANGLKILGDHRVRITHRARRSSRHNFKHMLWHLNSMMRYLWRRSGSAKA